MAKLTYQQKLDALSYRFYQGGEWKPKAGDFYTTSRADLELYQVVSVQGGVVRTRFTEGTDAISEWTEDGFLTEGFGPRRVYVPEWIICAPPVTPPGEPVAWRIMQEGTWLIFQSEYVAEMCAKPGEVIEQLFTAPSASPAERKNENNP